MIQIKPEYIEKKDHTRISRNFYNTLGSEVGCQNDRDHSRSDEQYGIIRPEETGYGFVTYTFGLIQKLPPR